MSIRFSTISNSATVQLATSVNPVDEGSSSVVTLTTTGIQNGQAIPYTISGVGITSDDIGEALTGNFVVQNGTATKTLNIAADLTTEGQETLTLSLGSQFNSTNVSLTVNDTSLTPVSGDMYYDNVVALLHFENNALDVKGHSFPATSISYSTSSKFGTYAAQFGGNTSVVTSTHNDFIVGTGDFTIEMWINTPGYAGDVGVFHLAASSTPNNTGIGMAHVSGNQLAMVYGNNYYPVASTSLTANTWHHIAVVRTSGTVKMYLDGVQKYSAALATNFSAENVLKVGGYYNNSYGWNGKIDDFRFTKGVARYTSAFTIPAAAFPDTKNENVDPFFNNVALLMHMDGTNGSTTFTDSSSTNKTLTSNGAGAVISTAQYKYGTASGSFSGNRLATTQFLIANTNEDFTLEAWVRPSSFGSFNQIVYGGVVNSQFLIRSNRFEWYPLGIVSPATITLSNWHHIAISRTNNVVRIFVNGQSGTPVTQSSIAYGQFIGAADNAEMFYGYMDDLRITKGVGRYIANFTPPTRAFADNA